MTKIIKKVYSIIFILIPTFINAVRSGVKFNPTHQINGKIEINRSKYQLKFLSLFFRYGSLKIGDNFKCNNTFRSNSIGCFQRCFFNLSNPNSLLYIGDNVGISGTTIKVDKSVIIGNNVLIGSGCLITDSDSHPLESSKRIENDYSFTMAAPIVIEDNVFIGARSIILKGVKIGSSSVIGAGSVVTKDIPSNVIAGGNPAKVIRQL